MNDININITVVVLIITTGELTVKTDEIILKKLAVCISLVLGLPLISHIHNYKTRVVL